MVNDENIGKLFEVVIPHKTNNSMLNAIVVGDRHLQKDSIGFFVKWCPSDYGSGGKLRHIKMSKSGKRIIVNPHIRSGKKITIKHVEDSYYV